MKRISIIINTNHDISAILSLLQQNTNSWECIILNNLVKDIDKYINKDSRFKIINKSDIKDAVKSAKGEYILFANSDDIFVSEAISNILHIINFTDADIIKFNCGKTCKNDLTDNGKMCPFKYIFNKNDIMNYAFNSLSEFCFKKELISVSDKILLTTFLISAKDMASTDKTCILRHNDYIISTRDAIDNYKNNRTKAPLYFWKKYFNIITPKIIKQNVRINDKKSFIEFCNNIPMRLIPWRYRIICYILKKTNK